MPVPDRFVEMSDDRSTDPIQDRDAYDHDKHSLQPRSNPAQPKQGYRFGRGWAISKRRYEQQYGQKDVQRIAYERNVFADELLLVVFCHGDHLVRTDQIINRYGEKPGYLF